jgi:hypothetical protein
MKIVVCLITPALLAGLAFAQEKPAEKQAETKPAETKPAETKPADTQPAASTPMAEMKTQTYKGTLMDASCASGAAPAATEPAKGEAKGEANRSDGPEQSCSVSASTSQFALKTKDGKVMRFDMVGNERAQQAVKAKKNWSTAVSSGKPVRATVSGVVNGDKLTVVSIN